MVDALRRASAGRITAVIPTLAMRAGRRVRSARVRNHCEVVADFSPASVLTVCDGGSARFERIQGFLRRSG